MADPLLVKPIHNFCGLACILGLQIKSPKPWLLRNVAPHHNSALPLRAKVSNRQCSSRLWLRYRDLLAMRVIVASRWLLTVISWVAKTQLNLWSRRVVSTRLSTCILQSPPNSHPLVLEGLVRTKTFFTLLLGVAYSVSKSESSSTSEVGNCDHHRWDTNKQMRATNTPCVPFDMFLFYHWKRWQNVDHVRHRGLKEWFANRFSPRPYFAVLFGAPQAPCGVVIIS